MNENQPNEEYVRAEEFMGKIVEDGVVENVGDLFKENFLNELAELLCQENDRGYCNGYLDKEKEIKKALGLE